MSLRKANKIVVLLGAGASYKAGIPTSPIMINKLEDLLTAENTSNSNWSEYKDLYNFVKSAIHFADGISGKFNSSVNYNIERLVNTLSELNRKVEHPLYPFIGNWNIKLMELGGDDFSRLHKLQQMILSELQRKWVLLRDYSQSGYYQGLFEFARDYQYPLRVFTLNYDLCVEKNRRTFSLERGFREGRVWDWKNFDEAEGEEPNIFLYKMHGSIDWLRNENKNLTFSDEPANISPEELEIIFGTDYKLQYTDPFLFFAYEFRRWTLEAKSIIAIGYGFGDEHINGILGQALANESDANERKLIAVSPFSDEDEAAAASRLSRILNITNTDQICIKRMGAEDFMVDEMTIDKLNGYFPEGEDVFEELE